MIKSDAVSTRFHVTFSCSTVIALAVLLFSLTFLAPTGRANSIGLNIYGKSYHFLEANQRRDRLNETNLGLGVRASFGSKTSGTHFIEGGFFTDTFKHRATYIGSGYMVRLWQQIRVGFNAGIYKTLSINRGGTAAIVPLASCTVKFVTLNIAYLPKFRSINAYHTLVGYLTIHLINGEPKKRS